MLTLEGEVGTLGRKLNDYENVIAQFQDGIVDGFELVMAAGSAFMLRCRLNSPIFSEKKQLALAKAALKEKYDALRKNAVQLDQFRKVCCFGWLYLKHY